MEGGRQGNALRELSGAIHVLSVVRPALHKVPLYRPSTFRDHLCTNRFSTPVRPVVRHAPFNPLML
eukprot:349722-Chlamydomonas_euryale.AAC.4